MKADFVSAAVPSGPADARYAIVAVNQVVATALGTDMECTLWAFSFISLNNATTASVDLAGNRLPTNVLQIQFRVNSVILSSFSIINKISAKTYFASWRSALDIDRMAH